MPQLSGMHRDSADEMKRRSLVLLFGATILLVPVWSITYWLHDLHLAALVPLIYSVCGVLTLLYYRIKGPPGFPVFMVTCFGLYFILPPALQAVLGGYQNGSGVILWMFPVVIAAFIYQGARDAFYWGLAFMLVVIGSIFSPTLIGNPSGHRLPGKLIDVFYALNIVAIGGLIAGTVYYLITTISHKSNQLSTALGEVTKAKEKQEQDYFLISYLCNPLSEVKPHVGPVQVEYLIEQRKKFKYKDQTHEIGGDICISDRVTLRGKNYTTFLNGDAMGKSLQGAAGAIIMGSVFRACLARAKSKKNQQQYPEQWIKSCYLDFQKIFESFDGSMFMSVVFGLIDEERGFLYFINAEHPWTVLYRNGESCYLEDELYIRKLGMPIVDHVIQDMGETHRVENIFMLKTYLLQPGDVIIIGSDGRDDISIRKHETGIFEINWDTGLFLNAVRTGSGNLQEIKDYLVSQGDLTDDLSLMRIVYSGIERDEPERIHRTPKRDAREYARGLYHALEQRDFATAAKIAQEQIHYFPEDDNLYLVASICNRRINNLELAADLGECYHFRFPNSRKSLINLAKIYFKMGEFDRANYLLRRLKSIDPAYAPVGRFANGIKARSNLTRKSQDSIIGEFASG
jgi:tetratricopeptide (TPR) repeat protein